SAEDVRCAAAGGLLLHHLSHLVVAEEHHHRLLDLLDGDLLGHQEVERDRRPREPVVASQVVGLHELLHVPTPCWASRSFQFSSTKGRFESRTRAARGSSMGTIVSTGHGSRHRLQLGHCSPSTTYSRSSLMKIAS